MIAPRFNTTLPEMMKDKEGKMIVVPYESSGLIGSLTTIKELFKEVK